MRQSAHPTTDVHNTLAISVSDDGGCRRGGSARSRLDGVLTGGRSRSRLGSGLRCGLRSRGVAAQQVAGPVIQVHTNFPGGVSMIGERQGVVAHGNIVGEGELVGAASSPVVDPL